MVDRARHAGIPADPVLTQEIAPRLSADRVTVSIVVAQIAFLDNGSEQIAGNDVNLVACSKAEYSKSG